MFRKIFITLFIFSLSGILIESKGQGCSDAGFCSAGNLRAGVHEDSTEISIISLKAVYGIGEEGVSIVHVVPELNWQMSPRSGLQMSIPFVFTSGDLGSISGAGDVLLAYTYSLKPGERWSSSASIGARLATGKTDQTDGTFYSLPMPYQTGLGTYDLILGWSMVNKHKLSLATGVQLVLSDDNKNNFLYYPGIGTEELAYFQSNKLRRGNDALLRAGYKISIRDISITPGMLAIYRFTQDRITDITGKEVDLEGSDGLTLNFTAAASVPMEEKLSIVIEAGAPVIVRDVRADGLTRSLVASLALRYHFK
jgi:hypothetical protein